MKLDKNYKVRVTPEQSRKIQELAILLGFEWWSSLKKVRYEDEPFLFLNSSSVDKLFGAMDNKFEFDAHKFPEIQADDLIALLIDLSKSAENPLQGVELTPEFEAVEPVVDNCQVSIQDIGTDILDTNADIKDTPRFKAGDRVYFGINPKIQTIESVHAYNNIKFIGTWGCAYARQCCHATPENYERLQAMFTDIEFEQPPKELKGSDLARAMLARGDKYVVGRVGNHVGIYYTWSESAGDFFELCGPGAFDIEPIDPRTGEPLTESVLDE